MRFRDSTAQVETGGPAQRRRARGAAALSCDFAFYLPEGAGLDLTPSRPCPWHHHAGGNRKNRKRMQHVTMPSKSCDWGQMPTEPIQQRMVSSPDHLSHDNRPIPPLLPSELHSDITTKRGENGGCRSRRRPSTFEVRPQAFLRKGNGVARTNTTRTAHRQIAPAASKPLSGGTHENRLLCSITLLWAPSRPHLHEARPAPSEALRLAPGRDGDHSSPRRQPIRRDTSLLLPPASCPICR